MAKIVRVDAVAPALEPTVAFDHFTDPELLCRWWPQTAAADLRIGGAYHLEWPGPGWSLRGTYLACDRGERLAFTWQWDHQPHLQCEVEVSFGAAPGGGTRVAVRHTYGDGDDPEPYREGWHHFLGVLAGLEPD